jgi:hypothetical protein
LGLFWPFLLLGTLALAIFAMTALKLKYVTRLGASALDQLLEQLPADQPPSCGTALK